MLHQSIPFVVAVLYTLVQIFLTFVALRARKTSSLHTIILKNKTQTKHLIALIYISVYFPCRRIRYLKTITINTHIDCSNNSKCSVRDILLATKQGAFESVFGTFSVNHTIVGARLNLTLHLGKPTPAPKQVHQHSQDEPTEEPPSDTSTQTLMNKCLAESGIDPTDIQNVMSVSYAKRDISFHESSRQIQTHQRYVFARVNQSNHHLIDRGANGGLAGADMRVIHTTPRKINIVGIDDHELTGLNVVTAAALLDTQKGPIIGVFHEYAHLGKGRSIHAAGQMEWFNCQVDDRSKIVGGAQ